MNTQISLVEGVLELKNPILSASGTFGYGLEYQYYGDLSVIGGIVTNGLTLRPCSGAPMPRVAETPSGMISAVGTQNDGAEHFVRELLPRLPWNEVPVIPNLNASNVDEFTELASILSTERGVAAMEVNLSCRNDHRNGARFCENPVTAARAVNAVKRGAAGKPVIAKISPRLMDIVEVARAVEAAGADVISCIGCIDGMSVDLASRRSSLGSVKGGLSGPAVKPIALRCVWDIAQVVKIPIIGVGGIRSADDALEFILAGATAVEVGTASFSDPEIIFRIIRDLPLRCGELGINSLRELRGSLQV